MDTTSSRHALTAEDSDSASDRESSTSVISPLPAPSFNPVRLYDAGDGVRSLQSEMGLQDAPNRFRRILSLIRDVWREYDVDYQVSYKEQDPNVMREVETEVIRRMPTLQLEYTKAWPITFYLKRALKSHLPTPLPNDDVCYSSILSG
ncbi:hypothetical protein C8Q76DRAFT_690849 [Earliella scabrosa]|nr:hypothetical protein C8Q76DRAFT_690849 [Earliella scabrosa]